MAELRIDGLKVSLKFEPWALMVINGVLEALTVGVENGMPSEVAEEVAREIAQLVYKRGMKVDVPMGLGPVVVDDGFHGVRWTYC